MIKNIIKNYFLFADDMILYLNKFEIIKIEKKIFVCFD